MTLTRGFARNAATTPLDARLMDMAGLACNADGSPRAGVLGSANTAIVTPLATMNVAVAAAEFATTKGKADGVMLFTNDGTVNVAIAAAPASNSRIDVIWVKHNDNTTGDANSTPTFGVTAGTAAASPTKPAIPTGALELATLRVYAGTTAANGGSNILTNTYPMTAARGGVVPVRNAAEMNAWVAPIGAKVYRLDTGREWVREGPAGSEAWRPVGMGALLNAATPTSVANNTDVKIDFDDPGDLPPGLSWNEATREITVTREGRYRITASGRWQTNGTGWRLLRVFRNGAELGGGSTVPAISGIEMRQVAVSADTFASGDKLTVIGTHTVGVTVEFRGAQLIIESL